MNFAVTKAVLKGLKSIMDAIQEKDRQMETKPAQNIQDSFLNTARKDKTLITIYLLSGVKLSGRIRSFDKYSVVLETNNQEQLIFKHAISTVVMAKHRSPAMLLRKRDAVWRLPVMGWKSLWLSFVSWLGRRARRLQANSCSIATSPIPQP